MTASECSPSLVTSRPLIAPHSAPRAGQRGGDPMEMPVCCQATPRTQPVRRGDRRHGQVDLAGDDQEGHRKGDQHDLADALDEERHVAGGEELLVLEAADEQRDDEQSTTNLSQLDVTAQLIGTVLRQHTIAADGDERSALMARSSRLPLTACCQNSGIGARTEREPDRAQQHRPEQRADDRAGAAEDVDPAHDAGRDHRQLVAQPGVGVDAAEPGRPEGSRQAGAQTGDGETHHLAPSDRDSDEPAAGGLLPTA